MSPLPRLAPFMCVLVGVSGCGRDEPLPPSETGRYLVELTASAPFSAAEGIVAQAGGGLSEQKRSLQAGLPGLSVVLPLDELPMLVVTVTDRATYDALEASPLVAHVWPDARYELTDGESFGWVSQPATVAAGGSGRPSFPGLTISLSSASWRPVPEPPWWALCGPWRPVGRWKAPCASSPTWAGPPGRT